MESEHETASQFSEATSASMVPVEGSLYTCLACHVAFRSADNQRDHYRSDWHRYNLKRKVAELPPVTMDNFALRLKAQAEKITVDAAKDSYSASCAACRKSYSTENGYTNHLASKKHKELQSAYDKRPLAPVSEEPSSSSAATSAADPKPLPWRIQLAAAQTESELSAVIDAKIATATRLDPHKDCLFCTHTLAAPSIEDNLKHMALEHSFFVPDLEFLVDMEGLVAYLAEKVAVGNVCLFCNGKGRALHSLEAVRKHMTDKGHCKVEYENGGEAELGDFYDFSSTWDDDEAEDEEWEDMEGVEGGAAADEEVVEDALVTRRAKKRVPTISEDGLTLTLPSGVRILHKNAHVIRVPKTPLPDSLAITRSVAANYASMNAVALRSKIATMALEREANKQNYKVSRGYQDFRAKIGQSANKSTINKHYRSQIGFDS
ncbi:hypothetical protein HDU98_008458 [Podochytrium sp. JEL0797]|nr:hypothetical protein HDU98_008458 [Podochytrium sp. JEL0797]